MAIYTFRCPTCGSSASTGLTFEQYENGAFTPRCARDHDPVEMVRSYTAAPAIHVPHAV